MTVYCVYRYIGETEFDIVAIVQSKDDAEKCIREILPKTNLGKHYAYEKWKVEDFTEVAARCNEDFEDDGKTQKEHWKNLRKGIF